MSDNTATGQGGVFNVGNAELVSFSNVTFEGNSGGSLGITSLQIECNSKTRGVCD